MLTQVFALLLIGLMSLPAAAAPGSTGEAVKQSLERAGDHRSELQTALDNVPAEQKEAMEFLIAYLPPQDVNTISADRLLETVELATEAREQASWDVPDDVFLNYVLPHASFDEKRDPWRAEFREKFADLVEDAKTPGEAATILNNNVWKMLDVRYDARPERPNQSPAESIRQNIASCTGLSIILVDACRAVGVPARVVGTPQWSDDSGNHTWVEVWDDGQWKFTGAFEPDGDKLNSGWFVDRAAKAKRDEPMYAVYAASYKPTGLHFPMIWNLRSKDIPAVNVSDRYTTSNDDLPAGMVRTRISVFNGSDRCSADLTITDADGNEVFTGTTKDGRFDTNDHVIVPMKQGATYTASATFDGKSVKQSITAGEEGKLVNVNVDPEPGESDVSEALKTLLESGEGVEAQKQASADAVESLSTWLKSSDGNLAEQSWATTPLTKADAEKARELLWNAHAEEIRKTRRAEIDHKLIKLGNREMKFETVVFGEPGDNGRSLYISMHGGGGTRPEVNDQQWSNQVNLYKVDEGIMLAPRAPTNTWNLWHERHVDDFFDRLIEDMIVLENVDPDRVYLTGYSAGGDGTFQLAPRMADRFAAAAMMAGHPNDASALSLRNLPFAVQMGGDDAAYDRNKMAGEWKKTLALLHQDDPDGYINKVDIYPGLGHWMNRRDAAAVDWMGQFTRNARPDKVVWKQDDITHDRFYWLAVNSPTAGALVVATRDGQSISAQSDELDSVIVRLDDEMLDLDQPVQIVVGDQLRHNARLPRTIATMQKTLAERGDPRGIYSAEVEVKLK